MATKINNTDPTYLRTIHDGLLLGTLHKENASALPMGLVGMYEEALPPASNVIERKKFLKFFAVWALLKKEVSVAFLIPLLEGWSEETIIYYINKYSKWFNSPQSGKYVLYHERLRAFILQKISKNHFNACNETIIKVSNDALSRRIGDEWERYALEYLSNHMLIPAIEKGDGSVLKLLAYNTTHWNRQVEISKGFEWSKRMLNNIMLWASKYDDNEVIECALNKVDLHHQEQNDAPRIVELVAQNDIETALDRIDKFGGQDKEGLQRKFILYMLCLMELTLLESKDKPFRRDAIEKLLKHLDENLPADDYSVLDWDNFFPSYLMFQLACEWAAMGLDYLIVYKRASKWENEWIEEKGPYSDSQFKTLIKFLEFKKELNYDSNKKILNELLKQGKVEVVLELVNNITDIDEKNEIIIKISRLLISKNDIEKSYIIIDKLIEKDDFHSAQLELVEEFILKDDLINAVVLTKKITRKFYRVCAVCAIYSKYILQEKNTKAEAALKYAIELTDKIQNNSWKLMALRKIAIECIKQNRFTDANKFIKESFTLILDSYPNAIKDFGIRLICVEFANKLKFKISLELAKKTSELHTRNYTFMHISNEMAIRGKFENARKCALYINNESDKSRALKDITIALAKQGKVNKALEWALIIPDKYFRSDALLGILTEFVLQGKIEEALECARGIPDIGRSSEALQIISSELAKLGNFDKAHECLLEISDVSDKSNALRDISIELAKIGKTDKSLAMMQEALRSARCIIDFDNKSRGLNRIYYALAEHGMIDNLAKLMQETLIYMHGKSNESKSFTILKEISRELAKLENINMALACARGINDESEKISALLDIQNELNKCDKIEHTLSVIHEALECARGLVDNKNKITLILAIATELTKYGKKEVSISLIQEALECTQLLIDNEDKSLALANISTALAIQGKFEDAAMTMNQSYECAQKIVDKTEKGSTLYDISNELLKQGKIVNAIECADGISDMYWKSDAFKCISFELAKQGRFDSALELARDINDNKEKSRSLSLISTELAQQGKIEDSSKVMQEALEFARDISNDDFFKGEVLHDISSELIKQGKLEDALNCANDIIEDLFQSFSLCAISKKLAEQENWHLAEEIGLDIKQTEHRQNCWKSLAGINLTDLSWEKRIEQSGVFQNTEAKKYYLKGFADSVTTSDCSAELILSARRYYVDDLESIEKLLHQHALHELFFQETSKEKIERFNRTLNIRWAIDIKNRNNNE